MLLVTGTGDSVTVTTGSAGAIAVHASYVDNNAGSFTGGRTNTPSITTATTTTVVAAPGSGIQRNVKHLSIFNTHASVSNLVTVQHTDGTNIETQQSATLAPGESLILDQNGDWTYYNAAGIPYVNNGPGRYLKSTLLTSGTSFTTGSGTNTIKVRLVGGGGGGAGCTSVSSAASAGGGGGAGGYAEKTFAVAPNTAYSYTIGAAGNGASGAAGGNGGSSTFVVGATTVTANGGQGAPVATAVTTLIAYRGGQGAAVSTNGDVNAGGDPGQMGIIYIAAGAGVSGAGASSVMGGGGLAITAVGNGNAATGYGAGGGGALTGASAARTGGNGTGGCIIVDEYS